MKITEKILNSKYGGLVFSLLSGLAYFIIIMNFIMGHTQNGGLLAFFFFPAIICGAALVLLKLLKRLCDEDRKKSAATLIYVHFVLILISLVFLIDIFM